MKHDAARRPVRLHRCQNIVSFHTICAFILVPKAIHAIFFLFLFLFLFLLLAAIVQAPADVIPELVIELVLHTAPRADNVTSMCNCKAEESERVCERLRKSLHRALTSCLRE